MSESINKAFVIGTGISVTQIIHVGGADIQRQELKLSLNFDSIRAGRDHGLPRLLKWNGRISPLFGRDDIFVQLRAWLADPNGKPVQIVSGSGGVGKTRLAAEFALELRGMSSVSTKSRWWKPDFWTKKLQPLQWKAGFVALEDFGGAIPLYSDEPALCILDYPEERLESMSHWIDALADVAEGKHNLRVLFVTRDAETVVHAFRDRHREHLLPDQAIRLAPVAADDGYRVLSGTLNNLANLGYPTITVVEADFAAWRKLSLLHESPLFVVALAIHLVGGDVGSPSLQLGGARLLDALCEREETRLQNIGKVHGATSKNAAADVIAWATLLDRLEPTERDALCEALLPDLTEAVLATLQASGALNENAPVLAHMEPDLLAAWWLHRWMRRLALCGTWDTHAVVLAGRMAQRAVHGWAICVPHWNRLGYDLTSRLGQTPNSIDQWVKQHITTIWQPYAAEVRAAFVQQTSWHGLPNAAIAASAVAPLPAGVQDNSESVLAARAAQLNNHAVNLSAAGERDAALAAAWEAVNIYRRLALANSAVFEPDFAMSLCNLASFISDVGERAAALVIARDAVEIYRRLALANSVAFEPDLAASLCNLANRLSAVGERAVALATAREAVEIYRRLALVNSAVYEPDFAMSLSNLANSLSAVGERAVALATAREAVEIYRRLALVNSAVYEPDFAMSLSNLAGFLSAVGERVAALAIAREAVEIRRRLALANSAAFEPDLAASFSNLSSLLSAVDEDFTALAIAREAVEIYRRLALANSAAFEPDLAASLSNLANRLFAVGERAAALVTAREAVEIRRRLALANSAAFEPDLAASLSNLANRLSAVGEHAVALATAREAVEIYRRLALANSAVYEPNLAKSLVGLAFSLFLDGDTPTALAAARESLALVEPWAQRLPVVFADLHDGILNLINIIDGATE